MSPLPSDSIALNIETLTRQRIVVTGASSGIGQATAWELARRGAQVLVHYCHNLKGAETTQAACANAVEKMRLVQADITQSADRARLVQEAWEWGKGHIDHWIHNAGADVLTGDARNWTFEAKLDRLWEVDVRATILLAREVLRKMRSQPPSSLSPSMVFIGWDQAWEGMEGDAGQMFGTTKGAIMAAAKSFAQEAGAEVRINCVAPGWIQTAWGQTASAQWQARAKAESLLNRWGQPQDIAQAIAYLCEPSAQFINAHILPVNGGAKKVSDTFLAKQKS